MTAPIKKNSEEDLAAHVVKWLEADAWDVFQEVQVSSYGNRADIVARRTGILWVIEAKKSLTFEVIAQARRWQYDAHVASIAVPKTMNQSTGRDLALRLCDIEGIGVLEVEMGRRPWDTVGSISQSIPAKRHRIKGRMTKPMVEILNRNLTDERKEFKAGNSRGEFWTPFRQTCQEALRKVKENPGITMKALMESIDHHYSSDQSARCSFAKWMDQGKISGLELQKNGRMLTVHLSEKTEKS